LHLWVNRRFNALCSKMAKFTLMATFDAPTKPIAGGYARPRATMGRLGPPFAGEQGSREPAASPHTALYGLHAGRLGPDPRIFAAHRCGGNHRMPARPGLLARGQ